MLLHRFAEAAEDDPFLRERLLEGRRDGDRIENRIDCDVRRFNARAAPRARPSATPSFSYIASNSGSTSSKLDFFALGAEN
jgi:hypothetical protein